MPLFNHLSVSFRVSYDLLNTFHSKQSVFSYISLNFAITNFIPNILSFLFSPEIVTNYRYRSSEWKDGAKRNFPFLHIISNRILTDCFSQNVIEKSNFFRKICKKILKKLQKIVKNVWTSRCVRSLPSLCPEMSVFRWPLPPPFTWTSFMDDPLALSEEKQGMMYHVFFILRW